MKISEYKLEALPLAVREYISSQLLTGLHQVTLQTTFDYVLDRLAVQLSAYVMAERLADESRTFEFRLLDGPWQRFKVRNFPTFMRFKILRPAKYITESRTVSVRSWATFLNSAIRFPDLNNPVYIQQVDVK